MKTQSQPIAAGEAAPTPTHYRWAESEPGYFTVYAWLTSNEPGHSGEIEVCDVTTAEQAAFIVRAANSHAALLALKRAVFDMGYATVPGIAEAYAAAEKEIGS